MTSNVSSIQPGGRVVHQVYGEGVVLSSGVDGYVRVFFVNAGERQVPAEAIAASRTRQEEAIARVEGTEARLRTVRLTYEAHALPLLESAAALTSARVDLLPHQVVLTHRIATASPRRFLIADEVGLGKTIETALVLRELASRGELNRALMIVPAGLVHNWHRELNEVFHLDFEIFGSEGDVTDRRSNTFAKHDRLIASIDTLKRPARIRRLLEAPAWDLVVFDEAHHLTAYRSGNKVTKTENYKLAEALRQHSRDLLLLSATPHQGDHFRFWMLIQLLNPTLFDGPEDMVENRHRLNSVVFRRTKADACRPDGSPLFARRWVHTESFTMSPHEAAFYDALRQYLQDGFALARRQGNQGQALGFVMAVFQKIAASSFVAVRRTLRRRLLALTIHEAIHRDEQLDIDGREELLREARSIIHEEYNLPDDPIGRGEADAILSDLRVRILRRLQDEWLAGAADSFAGESAAAAGEDAVATSVGLALPEERRRILDLLMLFPTAVETKVEKLLRGLGTLWTQNPHEKVVIFATYLGTVDLLAREIEAAYPGKGVEVLKGGDHGAKVAAEKRFKRPDGPRVLVCTAAGREGINLQFARILFNFDLPWNPMDLEQRIGRIHRYGQSHTAQVYNLVLSDTIEGRIFLLLTDKLNEIARTLGKTDENGNIAEDLQIQILGQLSERLTYDKLYQDALSDPELRRTSLELEAALGNAREARKVVFELFQDLDGFSLDDYKPFADVDEGVRRVQRFVEAATTEDGGVVRAVGADQYEVQAPALKHPLRYTTNRDTARESEQLDLMGLDHPLVETYLRRWRDTPPAQLAGSVASAEGPAVVTWWVADLRQKDGTERHLVLTLAVGRDGKRFPHLERRASELFTGPPSPPFLSVDDRERLLTEVIEPMLARDMQQRGANEGSFSARFLGWLEFAPKA